MVRRAYLGTDLPEDELLVRTQSAELFGNPAAPLPASSYYVRGPYRRAIVPRPEVYPEGMTPIPRRYQIGPPYTQQGAPIPPDPIPPDPVPPEGESEEMALRRRLHGMFFRPNREGSQ